jgi:multiple sugar transport system substrate-binding protein
MTRLNLGRALAHGAVVSVLTTSLMTSSVLGQSVDISKWSPE